MSSKDISIIIPVYNCEKTIRELCELLMAEMASRNYSYEIVLVNDGSRDDSHNICKELSQKYSQIKYLLFYKNFGQISALMAGLNECEGAICVIMDDDLQNPPEEIHKLVEAIGEGNDFVFAVPEKREQNAFRNWGSWFTYKMSEWMLGKPKDIYPSSFLALTYDLVQHLIKYHGPYPYLSGLIFRVTRTGRNVIVKQNPRKYGDSTYNVIKLLKLWLNGFTNFSVLPLRIASFIGLIISLLGFLVILILVVEKIFFHSFMMGWVSVFGAVLLFSGIQLIALGLLGEYIGRTFMLLNNSPQFVIKEKYNCKK